jgi:hypothetical protein
MAGVFKFSADPLVKRANDKGYRIGWKHRYDLVRGYLDGSMTYGEATNKAAELGSKDHDKFYWAEMILEPKFDKIG